MKKFTYEYILTAPQDWMDIQIQNDLTFYKNGINPTSVTLARDLISQGKLTNAYLITITNDGIDHFPSKLAKNAKMIVGHLRNMFTHGARLPSTAFVLGCGPAWTFDLQNQDYAEQLPPVFVFAADKNDPNRKHLVLFPDDHTLGTHLIGYRKGWRRVYLEIKEKRIFYPWHLKQDIAFWRGLPTDVPRYFPNISPRNILVRLSQTYPQLLDAKFTHTKFANRFIIKTLRPLMQILSIPPYVSYEEQLKYRILPNLDGETCTYPGFLWRLVSGSVVIKQETTNQQWFSEIIKPWEHYVPTSELLEDIIERIKWICANQQLAKEITMNAAQIVENSVMPYHIDAYILRVLNTYEELLMWSV